MWRPVSLLRFVRFNATPGLQLFGSQPSVVGVRNTSGTSNADEPTSFAMNIFLGKLKMTEVFPYPQVLTPEQKDTIRSVRESASQFYKGHDALRLDELENIDEATFKRLKEAGFFGAQVPEKYGGHVCLTNTQTAVLSELAGSMDLSITVMLGAHQSIGFKGILLFGTEEQKMKYLPQCAAGDKIAAFALTEPTCGSDAGGIKSRAVLSEDKTHYILNGTKTFITNGGIADMFTVFAKVPVTSARTGVTKDKVTAFIVERAFGGVTNGKPEKKMGLRCSNTAEVYFEDVKIPKENVLGELGGGFKVAMNILNNGRYGMGCTLTGTMRTCIDKAVEHASKRSQFGQTISSFGAIQEKIARMTIMHYVAESMAYLIPANMDRGAKDFQIEAAISKVFASEAAWYVVDEAIQVLGGGGYMRAPGLEKIMRDVRIFRIFEGTNDILRLFIALTGIQYAGSSLKEIQKAFKNPTANLGLIFDEGSKRALRMVGVSSSDQLLSTYVAPTFIPISKRLCKLVDDFGASVETLLVKHGTKIIEEQFLLNRLANAAIDVYTMSVVLSRASRSIALNHPSAKHETAICKVYCEEALTHATECLSMLSDTSRQRKVFERLATISKDVVGNNGLLQQHPLAD